MKLSVSNLLLTGLLVLYAPGCDEKENTTGPGNEDDPQGVTLTLQSESFLTPGCVDWPANNFSQNNRAGQLTTGINTGDTAIEFTLKDIHGNSHTLSSLLETKPVLMVFGAYT